MKINVTKKFDSSEMTVQVEDSDEKKAIMKALMFTQPDVCGECKGTEIRWDYNKAQTDEGDFIYIKRICKCGSQSTLGSYKGGGYFWKQWEKWENPNAKASNTAPDPTDAPLDDPTRTDDIF